jgi:hypothetical protein
MCAHVLSKLRNVQPTILTWYKLLLCEDCTIGFTFECFLLIKREKLRVSLVSETMPNETHALYS